MILIYLNFNDLASLLPKILIQPHKRKVYLIVFHKYRSAISEIANAKPNKTEYTKPNNYLREKFA